MTWRRLAFVLALVLLVSGLSGAQPATKIPRIGLLFTPSESFIAELVQVFRQGLRELGWVEGRTVAIESRYAEGQVDRLPRLAAELVALQVDVIVTADSPAINAAARATTTIPIVFAAAGDPVAAGHVSSLARPGGNITGLSLLATELSPKRLQLLKEAAPRTTRLAILFNPQDPSMVRRVQEAQAAAQALGMATVPLPVRAPGDFEGAFAVMIREHADCLLTVVDGLTIRNSKRIVDFASANRIPAVYEIRDFVERGGLLSYGPKPRENYRRAAAYVDKLLRGAKPTDLPVEQPTVFELVINLKTAKALGLTIPQSVLLRADQVIE